jgi:ubiquinone/menaquinone biosynthesis C-methylase UbiE
MSRNATYIPALGHDWLTPFYDALMRLFMQEEAFKRQLIGQAGISPGQRVLDLGCGTATLTILIKQAYPGAEVTGLDGDPRVLAIGRAKAAKAGVDLRLDEGMAFALPYPDGSFERALSSLVIHHLGSADKRLTMKEVLRVLTPGGEFHIADFGPPRTAWARLTGQLMAHFEAVGDNYTGLLPAMLREAGFEKVEETGFFNTIFGTLTLLRARKPA